MFLRSIDNGSHALSNGEVLGPYPLYSCVISGLHRSSVLEMFVLAVAGWSVAGVEIKLGGVIPCNGSVTVIHKVKEVVVLIINWHPGFMLYHSIVATFPCWWDEYVER